jgi:ketosteroid isomerase-like protein
VTGAPEPFAGTKREAIADVATRLIQARIKGDFAELRDLFDPAVMLRVIGEASTIYPFANHRAGFAEVAEEFARLHSMFECVDCVVLRMLVENDRVAFLRRMDLTHRGSGGRAIIYISNWLRVRDGRIVEIVQLTDNAALMTAMQGGRHGSIETKNPVAWRDAGVSGPIPKFTRDDIADRMMGLIGARVSNNLPKFDELLDPNVSLTIIGDPQAIYPFPNRRFGREAVLDLIASMQTTFSHGDIEILDMIVEGGAVVVMRKARLVHRGSGRSAEVSLNDWVRFRAGKAVEIIQINDNAALAYVLGGGS